MIAKFLSTNSKPFIILLAISGSASLAAYILLNIFAPNQFTWFIWIFLALPALALMWAPPLVFTLLLYWLLSRPFSFLPRYGRRIIGVLLTITLLFATPQWVRSHFELHSRELVSGDVLDKPQPVQPKIVALLAADQSGTNMSYLRSCGDFCQRVLLNNVAQGVALFRTRLLPEIPNPSMRGTLYRLTSQQDCPQIRYSRARWIRIRGEQRGDPLKGEQLLERFADDGRCIVSEQITLSQADVVIAAGLAKEGLANSEAGFNLLADTVSAKRIQLFVRRNGLLREEYRVTDVTAELPTVPLISAFNMDDAGVGIRFEPGFVRSEATLARSGNTNLSKFLTETLGFNLRLIDFGKP